MNSGVSIKEQYKKVSIHYAEVIKNFLSAQKNKISFAAYVMYESSFGGDSIFRKMLTSSEWSPFIVIIPDILRGESHQKENYIKTKEFFLASYGEDRVIDGWDALSGDFIDPISNFDIVYYANPYDLMAHKFHRISYALNNNVLPIYISYGYDIGRNTTLYRLNSPELNLVWKVFADSSLSFNFYKKNQIIKGKNVILSGYSKMDILEDYFSKNERKSRKKILIASHHSVEMQELPLSNFLRYYDFFLKLPFIYPDVDFVFRPHPLLFDTLVNLKIWSNDQVRDYIDDLKNNGIEYSTEGDYLRRFAECDAIINDCGSFTIECLYTGKPGCFMYSRNLKKRHLTPLMNRALDYYCIANTEKDILTFIDGVIKQNKQYVMSSWCKKNIAINYPNVSDFILNEINLFDKKVR